jgi:hypothetical protein
MEIESWYEAARSGSAGATKSFTLTVFDNEGKPIRKYWVERGQPTALLTQGDRRQITFKTEFIQRVAP